MPFAAVREPQAAPSPLLVFLDLFGLQPGRHGQDLFRTLVLSPYVIPADMCSLLQSCSVVYNWLNADLLVWTRVLENQPFNGEPDLCMERFNELTQPSAGIARLFIKQPALMAVNSPGRHLFSGIKLRSMGEFKLEELPSQLRSKFHLAQRGMKKSYNLKRPEWLDDDNAVIARQFPHFFDYLCSFLASECRFRSRPRQLYLEWRGDLITEESFAHAWPYHEKYHPCAALADALMRHAESGGKITALEVSKSLHLFDWRPFARCTVLSKLCIEDLSVATAGLTEAIGGLVGLKTLSLKECRLSSDSAALFNALKACLGLEELDLEGTPMQDFELSLSDLLSSAPRLQKLRLAHCELTTIDHLGLALDVNQSLETLDLSDNHLVDVSKLRFRSAPLEDLNLDINSIEDLTAVGEGLGLSSTLRRLSLNDNHVTSLAPIAEGITRNRTLLELYLKGVVCVDFASVLMALNTNSVVRKVMITTHSKFSTTMTLNRDVALSEDEGYEDEEDDEDDENEEEAVEDEEEGLDALFEEEERFDEESAY